MRRILYDQGVPLFLFQKACDETCHVAEINAVVFFRGFLLLFLAVRTGARCLCAQKAERQLGKIGLSQQRREQSTHIAGLRLTALCLLAQKTHEQRCGSGKDLAGLGGADAGLLRDALRVRTGIRTQKMADDLCAVIQVHILEECAEIAGTVGRMLVEGACKSGGRLLILGLFVGAVEQSRKRGGKDALNILLGCTGGMADPLDAFLTQKLSHKCLQIHNQNLPYSLLS